MLRLVVVLPQSSVGEVMPIEVQPFCRNARKSFVRIMSKVTWAGSASAKVTTRFFAMSRGSGSKLASSPQTWPAPGAVPSSLRAARAAATALRVCPDGWAP